MAIVMRAFEDEVDVAVIVAGVFARFGDGEEGVGFGGVNEGGDAVAEVVGGVLEEDGGGLDVMSGGDGKENEECDDWLHWILMWVRD